MAVSAFLPALVYEVANGAVTPVIALSALSLGGSAGVAAFMLALMGLGRLAGDLPAAVLADRFGERPAMLFAAAISVVAFLVAAFASSLVALGIALFVLGACSAVFTSLGRST